MSEDLYPAARLTAAAEAGRDAAHEQLAIGRAWLLPYLHATGNYSHYRQRYSYSNPKAPLLEDFRADFNQATGEITLSQPLFDLGRWADYKEGKLASKAGDIRFDAAFQGLLLDVSQAYVDVVVARSAAAAARSQEQAMAKLAEQARAAFKAGTKNINDSLDAQSRLDLARAQRIRADNDVAQAEATLSSLIGQPAPHLAVFDPGAPTPLPQPDDVAHWQKLAEQDSPNVRLAANAARQADEKVTHAVGSASPSLSLVGSLGYNNATYGQFRTGYDIRNEQIGVQLDVPLYAGGGTWATLRRNERLASEAELRLEDAKRQARLDAQAAFLAVNEAEAQVAALSDDIAYNNHAIDDGLRAGLFTAPDLAPVPLAGPIFAEVANSHPGLDAARLIHEAIRRMIDRMVSDAVSESRRRLGGSDAKSAAEIRALGRPVIGFSAAMREHERALRAFLFDNMYRHYRVNRMASKARRIVQEMFQLLLAEPQCLPTEWRHHAGGPASRETARVVADYIAGMTDRFALDEHYRLFDRYATT